MSSDPTDPAEVPYFHGRISRQEAEDLLNNLGGRNGTFLLREDMTVFDNYTLTIVYNKCIHHYQIERQLNGEVMIAEGRRFPGPVELVQYHANNKDGLITKPSLAVCRPHGKAPVVFHGITAAEMEVELAEKANKLSLNPIQRDKAFGQQRQQFMILVARDLHFKQPWYHKKIEREEAERRLENHEDGTFLVRMKDDKDYALSLQHNGHTKHYKISLRGSDKYAIETGPRFDSIMQMIDHYYNRPDGLLCRLSKPCARPGMVVPPNNVSQSTEYTVIENFFQSNEVSGAATSPVKKILSFNKKRPPPPPTPGSTEPGNRPPAPNPKRPPPTTPQSAACTSPGAAGFVNGVNSVVDEENQKIYDSLPICEETFNLKRDHLHLMEELGGGCFGSVMKGTYVQNGKNIPVAVKTLKKGSSLDESAMMKEARLMSKLKHRHIVRMIGLCRAEMLMLVLELAPLGPLHKYLKRHPEMTVRKITELIYQVARGMDYLESQNFIHRDLAARNVLLVNEEFAKISDFGMSKALGWDTNYYMEAQPGKWPIKWYAPECFYYYKFDSKSDVWSFGVTMWEAMSYGKKPYPNLKGPQILQYIESGKRLDIPENCPRGIYELMLSCWENEKEKRPKFSQIVDKIKHFKS